MRSKHSETIGLVILFIFGIGVVLSIEPYVPIFGEAKQITSSIEAFRVLISALLSIFFLGVLFLWVFTLIWDQIEKFL